MKEWQRSKECKWRKTWWWWSTPPLPRVRGMEELRRKPCDQPTNEVQNCDGISDGSW